ncbi:hypothetical protein [Skermanella aerolata]|uniref:hypothetical protein n=1 Tax=Skermanella aerolata TaxID=393310 RepID=UPI0005C843C6|nr:hypothetical protein [Skermanella aerolata]
MKTNYRDPIQTKHQESCCIEEFRPPGSADPHIRPILRRRRRALALDRRRRIPADHADNRQRALAGLPDGEMGRIGRMLDRTFSFCLIGF